MRCYQSFKKMKEIQICKNAQFSRRYLSQRIDSSATVLFQVKIRCSIVFDKVKLSSMDMIPIVDFKIFQKIFSMVQFLLDYFSNKIQLEVVQVKTKHENRKYFKIEVQADAHNFPKVQIFIKKCLNQNVKSDIFKQRKL